MSSNQNDELKSTHPEGPSKPFQQWYLVGILTLTYTLSFVDRATINLVVEPIKHDLAISDVQISLLLGFSFVLLYSGCSIPSGYLVDRLSRKPLVMSAILFWSGSAIFCGHAGSYSQLFVGRAGLGVGESALPPAAYSMMRDGVAESKRARAFSIYQAGLTLGYGVGFILGGTIFSWATMGGLSSVPLVNHLKPWQQVIVLPGIFGVLVTLLWLRVKEPPRQRTRGVAEQVGFREALIHMRANIGPYFAIFAAVVTVSIGTTGWSAWIPASLGRTWGITPGEIGPTIGILGLALFPPAGFLLGWLMDFTRSRGHTAGPFWIAAIGCALNIVPAIAVLNASSLHMAWISYGFFVFFSTSGVQISCGYMLSTITPGRMMGKVTAAYYLTANMLAASTGPTIVASVSQYIFGGGRAISESLLYCYTAAISVTIIVLLFGVSQIRKHTRSKLVRCRIA